VVGEIIASTVLLSAEDQEKEGILYCDGTDKLRSSYPDLFAVIGTSFGATGGTTFNVPNYKSAYLKGSDEIRSIGSHEHSNNKEHSHYFTADNPNDSNKIAGHSAVFSQTYTGYVLGLSEGSTEANVYNFPVYFYIRSVDYVKRTYDMLLALIDANVSKDNEGVYDYTKFGKWVVGSGATERTLYLSEQLRQVLAYNYGGLV